MWGFGFRDPALPWLPRLWPVWGVAPVVEALPFVTPQPVGIHGETKELTWKATK